MAQDVLEASPAARRVFEEADSALGEKLSTLILEGPEERLTLTANAQPAILATSQALLSALRERVPNLRNPAFAAGHSLGEYSALVASGALTLADAIRLLRARGHAMQEAVPPGVGAMAAIMGVEPARLRQICEESAEGEVVSAANFNAPGQVVIAGHVGAVKRAVERVAAAGGKAIPLRVSAPFHCALMAPVQPRLAAVLGLLPVKSPRAPVVANVTAAPNADAAQIVPLLVEQVTAPVRWVECVRQLKALGATDLVELGAGNVLAGLVKRIDRELRCVSVSDPATLAKALGELA